MIFNTTECPDGWFYLNGRCLLISKNPVTFDNAIKACGEYSGVLASIHSVTEAEAIYGKRTDRNHLYIGLYSPTNLSGDAFVNLDGTQPDWKDFVEGQWEACIVTKAWSGCCPTYYTKLRQVPCDFISDGYICQIATEHWTRLRSDLALKALTANALRDSRNETSLMDRLFAIRDEMKALTVMKVKKMYERMVDNVNMVNEE